MCTILLQSETLSAEKRSRKDSQAAVDKLMEYNRKLSEPFTREELQKIFDRERLGNTSISKYCDTSDIERYIDYTLLTDAEKEFVKDLGLPPSKPDTLPEDLQQKLCLEDRRRQLKAELLASDHSLCFWKRGASGHIYVWMDTGCYCKSKKRGFYDVRYYNSLLQQTGLCGSFSTAYAHPVLVVQKSKLCPDQVEFMERLRQETIADTQK